MCDTPSRFIRAFTPTELGELARLRREHPQTLGPPAEVVLMSARRLPIPEIMSRLGVSRPTVTGWLTRFERSGIFGLAPRLTSVGLTAIKATPADDAAITRAAQLAAEAAQPSEDLRGSVEYKRDMVRVLTARALRQALERAGAGR